MCQFSVDWSTGCCRFPIHLSQIHPILRLSYLPPAVVPVAEQAAGPVVGLASVESAGWGQVLPLPKVAGLARAAAGAP